MTIFHISAPGRIILSGDYIAMYGKQVVAASLNIRTKLTFFQLPQVSTIIKIEFPDVALSLDVSLEIIVNFMSNESYNIIVNDYIFLHRYVKYFIILNGLSGSYEQKFSLQIFFFLLFYIASKEGLVINSFCVFVATQLPMKEGLGSSTSFATCLAGCFLHWACLQKGDHNEFTVEELTRISEYVMYSEEVIQNYVYHEDYNVCTRGYVTAFRCTGMLNVQSEHINAPQMNILLVDANIRLDKSQQMKELAAKRYSYGNAVDILNDIDYISQGVVESLHLIPRNDQTDVALELHLSVCETLEASFPLYQTFLRNLSLSHSNFDTICSIAKKYGFEGKQAGEGTSYVIIILRFNASINKIQNFIIHLQEEGFILKATSISCSGVQLE